MKIIQLQQNVSFCSIRQAELQGAVAQQNQHFVELDVPHSSKNKFENLILLLGGKRKEKNRVPMEQ